MSTVGLGARRTADGSMDDDQQFCLRWNNHQSTLVSVFDTLLEKGIHVDCTLAAEGQTLKAHKVVLSACSPYFETVLSQQYDKHPIIILKDVKYAELRAMMDYMYRGEVNISQDQLAALLKAAESLQIKGLSDNKPSRPPSRPPPPAQPALAPAAPRAVSPPPQARDGSIDSRDGSVSPARRRKVARRLSTEGVGAEVPQGNGDDATCKEEQREGVEDLTIDEEADEPPNVTHNDVVRNFQWHMERSQDELLNSNDGVRDSQGRKTVTPRHIVTRSKKVTEETEQVATFAILKPAKPAPERPKVLEETKENKKLESPPEPTPVKSEPDTEPKTDPLLIRPKIREKGHKCPNCGRAYNARKNLVRHITLECGREPQYKCPHCDYRKHRRNELKKHMERKHRAELPDSPGVSPANPVAVK